ncbi:MAG: substrate-binding domain-containing protein [Anaerolineae bacterium]
MHKPSPAMTVVLAVILLSLTVTPLAMAACPNIEISGSTTVEPIIRLAEAPFEAATGYNITDGWVASGSSAGIKDLLQGTKDIIMSSRDTKSSDDSAPDRRWQTSQFFKAQIAIDGICWVVNVNSPLANVTVAELTTVYKANSGPWTIQGYTVMPRMRSTDSGTYGSVNDFLGMSAAQEATTWSATGLPRLTTSQDVMNAIAADASGQMIGYVGVDYAFSNPGQVKVLSLGGVSASERNIRCLTYPMSRYIYLMTIREGETPIGQGLGTDPDCLQGAYALINYVKSPVGQARVEQAGSVKLFAWEDCNQDGSVDIGDVGKVGLKWGQTGGQRWIWEDVNGDGSIDIGDVGKIGLKWGEAC